MPVNMLGGTAIKPVERHGWDAVSHFLYDPDKGAIMGRTPKSWALITVFYIIYYTCLALFWAACMLVFFQTIDDKTPRWTTSGSLIGESPALGVRPEQAWELIDSSMIMYNQATEESTEELAGWKEWKERTDDFLETYRNNQKNNVDCGSAGPGKDQVCKFDVDAELGPCAKGNYGYDLGKPCVYLKLNKIYGLEHLYYNTTSFPTEEKIQDQITRIKDRMAKENEADREQVWVDCHGENAADIESMGDIEYFPKAAGFHKKYHPYLNQQNYANPLIAVQFKNPTAGQLIHIECRAHAKNINYERRDKIGKAHFELLIHNAKTA